MSLTKIYLTEREVQPDEIESEEPELSTLHDVLSGGGEHDYDGWGLDNYDAEGLLEAFHDDLTSFLHKLVNYEDVDVEYIDGAIESEKWYDIVEFFDDSILIPEESLKEKMIKFLVDSNKEIKGDYGDTNQHMYAVAVLKDEVLFHFTDDANSIVMEGFKYGARDPKLLGLTTHYNNESYLKVGGGYNFAYDENSIKYATQVGWGGKKYKYGEEIVALKANAVKVWHHSDGENQCIFWGKNARHVCEVSINEDDDFFANVEYFIEGFIDTCTFMFFKDPKNRGTFEGNKDRVIRQYENQKKDLRKWISALTEKPELSKELEDILKITDSIDTGAKESEKQFRPLIERLKGIPESLSQYEDTAPLVIEVSGKEHRVMVDLGGSKSKDKDLRVAFEFVKTVIDEM